MASFRQARRCIPVESFENMKNLTILLLFSLIGLLSCNSKLGIYVTPRNYTGFSFVLEKKNKFEYSSWGCHGEEARGVGRFEIKADTINFKFSPCVIAENNYQISEIGAERDSIVFDITVIEKRFNTPYVQAEIIDEKRNTFIKRTDYDGKAQIKIEFKGQPMSFLVRTVGYPLARFTIDKPGKYDVVQWLDREGYNSVCGKIWKYKVIKWTKDSLIITGERENWERNRNLAKKRSRK